ARDRGAVEAHPRFERVVQLGGVDRERLQLPEDVREPEADEADLALLHERLDIIGGLRLVGHPAGTLAQWPPGAPSAGGARGGCAAASAPRPRPRNWPRPALLCPGRAARASARAPARGLLRSRSARAPCARTPSRCPRRP